jgi:hypothetical protein
MSAIVYKTVEIPTRFWMFPLPNATKQQEALDTMSAAGWELATSNTVGANSLIEKVVLTFKKSGSKT